uniref:U4/U6.U5 tri-snRNP-associated protein 3 n=1 Tax=Bos indicus x Bos taurus TaxID=30522 RepID=A0A4W2EFS0_BOBOX
MGLSCSGSPRMERMERRRSGSTSGKDEPRRLERSQSGERRSRSRSPRRHRSTSPAPSRLKERRDEKKKETKETKSKEHQITEEDLEGNIEEEIEMKLMGFASFDSTKGKKAVHELKRWIQQTFGFHCMRTEVLKNDFFFPPHLDQTEKADVDFVFNMHQKQAHSLSSL